MPKLVSFHQLNTSGGMVVIAAREGDAEDYAAYICTFPGHDYHSFMLTVTLETGEKIPREWAPAMFPDMAERFTWRP